MITMIIMIIIVITMNIVYDYFKYYYYYYDYYYYYVYYRSRDAPSSRVDVSACYAVDGENIEAPPPPEVRFEHVLDLDCSE